MLEDKKRKLAEFYFKEFLKEIGQDVDREGIQETPKRYVNFFDQFLNQADWEFKTFEKESDEMIIVKDIPFYSLCEHHVVPFFGTAAVAYIPNEIMVGLSKIPRTVNMFSGRLQNQERITRQIAAFLQEKLNAKGVAVVLNARHMCMEMRGVKSHGANTTTSELLGVFKEHAVRTEFFNLIK